MLYGSNRLPRSFVEPLSKVCELGIDIITMRAFLFRIEPGQMLVFNSGCRLMCLSSHEEMDQVDYLLKNALEDMKKMDKIASIIKKKMSLSHDVFKNEGILYMDKEWSKQINLKFFVIANPNDHYIIDTINGVAVHMFNGKEVKISIVHLTKLYAEKAFEVPKYIPPSKFKIKDIWKKLTKRGKNV